MGCCGELNLAMEVVTSLYPGTIIVSGKSPVMAPAFGEKGRHVGCLLRGIVEVQSPLECGTVPGSPASCSRRPWQ